MNHKLSTLYAKEQDANAALWAAMTAENKDEALIEALYIEWMDARDALNRTDALTELTDKLNATLYEANHARQSHWLIERSYNIDELKALKKWHKLTGELFQVQADLIVRLKEEVRSHD